jgi:hypothetical protein
MLGLYVSAIGSFSFKILEFSSKFYYAHHVLVSIHPNAAKMCTFFVLKSKILERAL